MLKCYQIQQSPRFPIYLQRASLSLTLLLSSSRKG